MAAYEMAKAGAEVILLHMDNRPYADDGLINRAVKLAEQLRKETGQEMPLYMAAHGPTQKTISERVDSLYQCVLCKHAMQLTAKALCIKLRAKAVVMGDSLGQVASQTLLNIRAEMKDVDFPILRPLIGYDKLEIIEIAERIGTMELSNLPAVGCTIVPKKVVTESDIVKAQSYYEVTELNRLAQECAENATRLS
ncbi:MAG: tRNA 4-thiouridine(8) synthase ThiI [archaeon]|nr:tRNA 4-thiouridine(8) synthase ThiI [archaeon]